MPGKLRSPAPLFTPAEVSYLQSQRLGRLATVGPDGQPHVVPVEFRYNPQTGTIDVGGRGGFARRKKWRDVTDNARVAIVFDDVVVGPPRQVRGLEVRGNAEMLASGGETIIPGFDLEVFRIRPVRVVSWGINTAEDAG